jgi:hypothetical protein
MRVWYDPLGSAVVRVTRGDQINRFSGSDHVWFTSLSTRCTLDGNPGYTFLEKSQKRRPASDFAAHSQVVAAVA